MKKLIAISLFTLLLFNLVGYRLFFVYTNNALDKLAEISFNNDQYDKGALITIKVPLHIPYQTDQSEFQRADGKININGKVYRYIKRKVINNEMVLVCVADNKATILNKDQNDFLKNSTGLFDNNASKKAGTNSAAFFMPLPVFKGNLITYNFSVHKFILQHNSIQPAPGLLTSSKKPPQQPPDFI